MDCAVCDRLQPAVEAEQLKEDSVDFASAIGILMKVKDASDNGNTCSQVRLFLKPTLPMSIGVAV